MRKDRERVAKAFGRALKRERKRVKLSQEELAFRAKVDRTFVSLAERGRRQPALATVFLLAKAIGTRPAALVELTDKQLRSPTA